MVNIASLIRSKARTPSLTERWGREMGRVGRRILEGEFKEFYGQRRRGHCWLDLEGAKLFLLPLLSFVLSPISGVRKQ